MNHSFQSTLAHAHAHDRGQGLSCGQDQEQGQDHVHYRTDLLRWRAAEGQFESWLLEGVELASDGSIRIDVSGARRGTDPYPPGGYHGHNFYNGGSYLFG